MEYWAVNMAPTVARDKKILTRELDKFSAQTGIKVDLRVLNWADLYTRTMAAVTSGRGPDVIDIGNTWSASLQDTGAFLAFDDAAMRAIGGRDRFVATCMSSTGVQGKAPASIPLYGQSFGLYYNTKLFEQAGISHPPATWEEFVADARRLTKPGQWGVSLNGASAGQNAHLAFVLGRQHGARLLDAHGVAHFASPPVRSAVTRLLELMSTHKVVNPSDAEHGGINDALAALAHGRAAMVPFQSGGRTYLDSVGFHDYAVAPLPSLSPTPADGTDVRSFVAGTNVAVFDNTAHRSAALKLVRFLTSDAEQIILNKAFGTLPVVNAVQHARAFADSVTRTFTAILREHSETMPMVPDEARMETLLGGAISTLWAKAATGSLTNGAITAALRDATEQMTAAR